MEYFLGLKIDAEQKACLESLVKRSGRTRSGVVQRLITYAVTSPEALKALGIVDNNRIPFDGRGENLPR